MLGENPLITGTGGPGMTVKLAELVAVPPGVVTAMGPVVAVEGRMAVICEPESTVNEALTPLKVTCDTL